MKSTTQIEKQIHFFEGQLHKYQEEYSDLNQIDMLSGTGNQLLERINRYIGYIKALKWVLND